MSGHKKFFVVYIIIAGTDGLQTGITYEVIKWRF